MFIAITREVSSSINQCELTNLEREPIDYERACEQHAQYESALKHLGVAVLSLPEEPTLADSVFLEDTALVLDECAIITRPGADSRRPETESIAKVLAPYRRLFFIEAPARVDGGDILRIGKKIYVGISTRSDTNAIEQMQDFLAPFGIDKQSIFCNLRDRRFEMQASRHGHGVDFITEWREKILHLLDGICVAASRDTDINLFTNS